MSKLNIEETLKESRKRMDTTVSAHRKGLESVRTNRASTGLIADLKANYYGSSVSFEHIARITVGSELTLLIEPWDRAAVEPIVKAIQESDIGVTPMVDGAVIHLNIPPLSEERRREIVRMIKKRSEEAKVSIRNARRSALDDIRSLEKDGECSKDEAHRAQGRLQGITDSATERVDEATNSKEKEIMQV